MFFATFDGNFDIHLEGGGLYQGKLFMFTLGRLCVKHALQPGIYITTQPRMDQMHGKP
jgi:hypothetical protein